MNLTDTALCSAACAVQSAMLSALPEPEECPDYDASPGFERRMLRLLNDPAGYVKKMSRSLWQWAAHTAAMAAVSLGLSLALACAVSPSVRAAVKQWFMAVRQSDIVYYFTGETKKATLPKYTITALPEGFFYCNETGDDISRTVRYANADGDFITFRYAYMETGSAFVISTVNMAVHDVTVGTFDGQVFISSDPKEGSAIVWIDQGKNYHFFISAFADESVLLHMAESISLLKTEEP